MTQSSAPSYQYGSIPVVTLDTNKNEQQDSINPEASAAFFHNYRRRDCRASGSILLATGIALLFLASWYSTTPTTPTTTTHKNKMWQKVQRSPGDTPHYFSQKVDHFDSSNTDTWPQRYFIETKFFRGPGHPIILVVGGEGGIDTGMFYPFVDQYLAEHWGALVLHPEHRFYGVSQPVDPVTNEELVQLLTLPNAIEDMLAIVRRFKNQYHCSLDKTSPHYCPVIAVGGSYPAFVATLMRIHYPDQVDIAYASSAPLKLWTMEADPFGYMDVVTRVTDQVAPGCAQAVRETLAAVDQQIRQSDEDYIHFARHDLNICPGTIPTYITNAEILSQEMMMIVGYTFADFNMFAYPPDHSTDLYDVCHHVFLNDHYKTPTEKLSQFWKYVEFYNDNLLPCFDMSSQLPAGHHASISGADWSGVGVGYDGMMFDFHCCSTLTPAIGFSHESMFPYRPWTLEWLTQHCERRFQVTPKPYKLLHMYHFDDLIRANATKILFTNGLNDMWSAGSLLESISDDLPVINMVNGAHHSDLSNHPDDHLDTRDVVEAHQQIRAVLEQWLKEIRDQQY
jgi:pimeloyl-ACP methyl ester carboxylesterase